MTARPRTVPRPPADPAALAEAVGSDGVLAVEESSVKAFWEACGGIRVWDRDVRP